MHHLVLSHLQMLQSIYECVHWFFEYHSTSSKRYLNVGIYRELVPGLFEDMTLCLMSEALPCGPGIVMGWESVIPMAQRFLSLPQALTEKKKIMDIVALTSQIPEIPGPG